MAALQPTNTPSRHVIGDLVMRFYNLSGNNGDTLTVAGASQILQADPVPTTAISLACTFSGNVITFVSAGAWTATVMVTSRVG